MESATAVLEAPAVTESKECIAWDKRVWPRHILGVVQMANPAAISGVQIGGAIYVACPDLDCRTLPAALDELVTEGRLSIVQDADTAMERVYRLVEREAVDTWEMVLQLRQLVNAVTRLMNNAISHPDGKHDSLFEKVCEMDSIQQIIHTKVQELDASLSAE